MRNREAIRIAYFAEIFPSSSETWVHHEVKELRRLGYAVHVFATRARPKDLPPELQQFQAFTTYLPELSHRSLIMGLPARLLKLRLLLPLLWGLVSDAKGRRQRVQVLRDLLISGLWLPVIQDFNPAFLFAHFAATRTNLALIASILTGVPFAFKMHAADVFGRVPLLRLKSERATWVLTISEYNLRYIRDRYADVDGLRRLQKHACGIPLDHYKFHSNRELPEIPFLVAVGRLVRMKGFDDLLRASRLLLNQDFDHRVVIIGDGPERHHLEALCAELVLAGHITFKGYCGPEEVRATLLSATAFVLPAVWDGKMGTQDGIPVALMEAMAVGVPAVSTSTSGIPELIEDGISGFLASPNDPQSLATAIRRACELMPDLRNIMSLQARSVIEQNHDVRVLTAALAGLIEEAI